jgi:large conductance mechanosensitive channel
MLKEFRAFVLRGNVIDLAVAVIIGAAFAAIVTAISTGLITPLVGMVVGKSFADMTFTINDSVFNYGIVIDAIITFVSFAAVIFFLIVKPMQAIQARRAAGEPTEDTPAPSDEALLLAEIRDLLRARP